jgi:hypothetical protein
MEARTIARDMIPGSRGRPNSMPANLMPAAPPRRLPGKSPKIANRTSPAPAPIYDPCLVIVVFIFLPSLSLTLDRVNAVSVPKHNILNFLKRWVHDGLQK